MCFLIWCFISNHILLLLLFLTGFKSRIDSFRLKGYKENRLGHFWELSYDIYDRVEVNLNNRMKYTSFMKEK